MSPEALTLNPLTLVLAIGAGLLISGGRLSLLSAWLIDVFGIGLVA